MRILFGIGCAFGLASCATEPKSGDPEGTTPTSSTTETGAPEPGPDPYDVVVGPYESQIRWTEYGIPHIQADDYGSLGYGLGFAFAADHACTLLDQVIMVRSERAKWFGHGPDDLYIDQDFGWLGLKVVENAEAGWFLLSADMQSMLVGYAAGFNRWLADTGVDNLPDTRCAGAPWVREINHIDLLAYYLAFGLQGSGAVFVDAVGSASPPASFAGTPQRPPPPVDRTLGAIQHPLLGSNGWALGATRTASGSGMLLSNTHFPAVGERKWYEFHLTLPGKLDVYGSSLMGVPVVNIGFNANVAWTHTVSSAPRFVAVLLELDPENPTVYNHYGTFEAMTSETHTIEVGDSDGSVSTVERTLWYSAFGPVLNAPVFGWSPTLAVALQDANDNNLAMLPTWFEMNHADSLAAFQDAQATHLGIPWVHTMAATSAGEAWYIDSSAVPNWSEAAQAAYPGLLAANPVANVFAGYGVYAVPSSDPTFAWVEAPGARAPGLIPYDEMPQLVSDDYVFNANDNHWLTNADHLLEGYSTLYGTERTARSPRTRMNLRYLTEQGPDTENGEDDLFTVDELAQAALSSRSITADLLLPHVLDRCSSHLDRVLTIEGTEVPLGPVCAVLADWDGRARVESRGAAIWREMLGSGVFSWADLTTSGNLWQTPFDANNVLTTPDGLAALRVAPEEDPILLGLAWASYRLSLTDFPLDATLGEMQGLQRGDVRYPLPGGTDLEGLIQVASWSGGASGTLLPEYNRSSVVNGTTDLTMSGYDVNYGNSWVMAVDMNGGSPRAQAVMVYGQSEVEDSPHYTDQTEIMGRDQTLRPIRFSEEDIAADPSLQTVLLTHD